MRFVPIYVPHEQGAQQSAALHEICTTLVPNFARFAFEDLHVEILSGGLTNILLHVYYEANDASPKVSSSSSNAAAHDTPTDVSVVVRVFGPDSERIVDRKMERFFQPLFLLTFGCGENCLVYEYLKGCHTLKPTEISTQPIMFNIARSIARFHWKATTASLLCAGMCMETPDCDIILTQWYECCTAPELQRKLTAQAGKDPNITTVVKRLLDGIACWFDRLRQMLSAVRCEMPVVMCHNDLLAENIMRREADGELILIDFEYTRRNYLYFEFANHFNEYAGFECDWSRFPAKSTQVHFMREYFCEHYELAGLTSQVGDKNSSLQLYLPSEERTFALVQFCTLLSHVKWILWSILQQAYSPITFDYLTYAQRRYTRFAATVEEFLSLVQSTGSSAESACPKNTKC